MISDHGDRRMVPHHVHEIHEIVVQRPTVMQVGRKIFTNVVVEAHPHVHMSKDLLLVIANENVATDDHCKNDFLCVRRTPHAWCRKRVIPSSQVCSYTSYSANVLVLRRVIVSYMVMGVHEYLCYWYKILQ
jgi:hypothetical protein